MTRTTPMYRLRRPGPTELSSLLENQSAADLSYGPTGATLSSTETPSGYHRLRATRPIGNGTDRFEAAKAAIEGWAGHRRAGALLKPSQPALEPGGNVALAIRVWPLWVTAACRIVDVIDEANRFGFAYGTLPHHPESGEESFVVSRDPATDVVTLEITAISRPASWPAKLGGPVGRAFQRFMAGRYLDGFENPAPAVAGPSSSPSRPVTSLRWWFENRETGELTIAQFPNWPLFAIGAATVARLLTGEGTAVNDGAGLLTTALWIYWGGDELVRGVNPWRRVLGGAVIGWQLIRLLT